jgi:hypothetical protein
MSSLSIEDVFVDLVVYDDDESGTSLLGASARRCSSRVLHGGADLLLGARPPARGRAA